MIKKLARRIASPVLKVEHGRAIVAIPFAGVAIFAGLAWRAASTSPFQAGHVRERQDSQCGAASVDYPPSSYLPLAMECFQTPRPTSTASATATWSPTSTATATSTSTPTATPTSTPTATDTPTATPTSTSTPEPCSCEAYPIAVHRSVFAGKSPGDQISDILHGTEEGKFGWLRWPDDPTGGSTEALAEALSSPDTCDFQNADDPSDTHLSVGDWIWANHGVGNDSTVRAALDNLVDGDWIRIIVWDQHSDEGGTDGMYHACHFAIVQLESYSLPGTNRISIVFQGFDSTGCVE
jgi:hypothetical protein